MANGYIGKISAVVTANSTDFERKLKTDAPKAVDAFARKIQSGIGGATRSAQRSIEQIFTPLQRLERQLKAAGSANLDLQQPARQIRALVSSAEQIARPLGSATKEFSRLSLEAQGAFLPALKRAQDQVLLLNRKIEQTGSVSARSFEIVENNVTRTAAAIQRLSQAQQLAASGLSGNELAFTAPAVRDELSRSAQLSQRAAGLSAASLADGNIGRDVQQLSNLRNLIVQTQAEIESGTVANVDTSQAETRLDRLLAASRGIRDRLESRITVSVDVSQAESLVSRIGRGDSLRLTSPAQFDALSRSASLSDRAQRLPAGAASGFGLAAQERAVAQQARAVEQLIAGRARLRQAGQDTSAVDAAIDRQTAKLQEQNAAYERLVDAAERYGRAAATAVVTAEDRVGRLTGNVNIDSNDPASGQAQRDIDALGSRVGAVRQQLETLPNSVRTQFIPALQQAQAQLVALQNSPSATADQIDQAAESVRRLESAFSNASKFSQRFSDTLGGRAVARQSASLEGLRSVLVSLGVTAGSRAAAAFEALRVAKQRAAISGDFESSRRSIARLEREAVEAAAAFSGLSAAQIRAQQAANTRSGDVGRRGLDKGTLALQQALFAVDDFFSVTGDLSQRLRAVGNNLTQLGFIAGGTTGLFISLGAIIGLQLVNFLSKFVFETDKADAALKSLNSALEANQRNVEKLASSYRSLGDAIASSSLPKQQKVARDRQGRVRDINESRQRAEEEFFASRSTEISRARGERGLLEKRREESRDIGERVRLTAEIEENRRREQELLESRGSLEASELRQRALDLAEGRRRAAVNRRWLRLGLSPSFQDRDVRQRALDQEIAASDRAADERRRIYGLALPGAASPDQTRQQISVLTDTLREAEASLAAARATGSRTSEELGEEAPRDVQTGEFLRPIDALNQTISDLRERLEVLSSVLGGQLASQLIPGLFAIEDSLSRTASLIDEFGVESSAITRERSRIASELTALSDRLAEASSPEEAAAIEQQIAAAQNAATALEGLTGSVASFADAIDRISNDLANTVAQEARSAADQARRDANAAVFGEDEDFQARRRRRLENDARLAEDDAARVRRQNASAVSDFERRAREGALGPEVSALIRERDAVDAVLRGDIAASDEQRNQARQRRREIELELGRRFEGSPEGRAAADRADRADAAAAERRQLDEDIRRGRELRLTDGERAGRELVDQINQITAAANEEINALPFLDPQRAQIAADRDADIARVRNEAFRQAAPSIFALGDSVQNALLQGPSRAALEATDVSTVEGARELNRLIRGDDAARNQDLVQLQREANRLLQLIADAEAGVANQ